MEMWHRWKHSWGHPHGLRCHYHKERTASCKITKAKPSRAVRDQVIIPPAYWGFLFFSFRSSFSLQITVIFLLLYLLSDGFGFAHFIASSVWRGEFEHSIDINVVYLSWLTAISAWTICRFRLQFQVWASTIFSFFLSNLFRDLTNKQ